MNTGKWIIRSAALILLLGFFLPAITVSCTGGENLGPLGSLGDLGALAGLGDLGDIGGLGDLGNTGSLLDLSKSFSLAQVASTMQQSVLYLFPLAVIALGVLSIFQFGSLGQQKGTLYGQLGAFLVGLIALAVPMISLNDKVSGLTLGFFEIKPAYGAFIVLFGLIAFLVGWFMELANLNQTPATYSQAPVYTPPVYQQPPSPRSFSRVEPPTPSKPKTSAWLITQEGHQYQLCAGETNVGRSSTNDVHFSGEGSISRQHAKINEKNGRFYITDLASSGGTRVNKKIIRQTTLLESGDEIQFGEKVVVKFVSTQR